MIVIRLLGHKAQEGRVKSASRLICPVLTLEPSCSAQNDRRPADVEQSLGKSEVGLDRRDGHWGLGAAARKIE